MKPLSINFFMQFPCPQTQESGKQAIKKLVAELENQSSSKQRDEIIEKAKQGYYSDFQSPIAMPKMQLVQDLNAAGLRQIAEQVMNGQHDG